MRILDPLVRQLRLMVYHVSPEVVKHNKPGLFEQPKQTAEYFTAANKVFFPNNSVTVSLEKSVDKHYLCLVYKRDCFLETTDIY
jgi:hypothetical protein